MQINEWLKNILNLFKSRKTWKKTFIKCLDGAFAYGKTLKEVDSQRLQCSKSSVQRTIEKFKKHKVYDDKKKRVGPVKLYEEMIAPSDGVTEILL